MGGSPLSPHEVACAAVGVITAAAPNNGSTASTCTAPMCTGSIPCMHARLHTSIQTAQTDWLRNLKLSHVICRAMQRLVRGH